MATTATGSASVPTAIPYGGAMQAFSFLTEVGGWEMHTGNSITTTAPLPWSEAGQSGTSPATAVLSVSRNGEGTTWTCDVEVDLSSMPEELRGTHHNVNEVAESLLGEMVGPLEMMFGADGPDLGI